MSLTSRTTTGEDAESFNPDCDTLDLVIQPRFKDLGGGTHVRRVLPFHKRRMVGPFVFFDHFGPAVVPPGKGMDVRPHPHIGLATVTYLFEGAIAHKDSVGSDLVIRPGAVNWMTAGRGITHSERTPPEERAAGHTSHGIQTWVALPADKVEMEPSFTHHPAESLPKFTYGGAEFVVIAGSAWGHTSPVEFPHPIWYLAGEAPHGAEFTLPADAAEERALYVADGQVTVGRETLDVGSMGILAPNCDVPVKAAPGAKFMLAGGGAMPEGRVLEWNFVALDKTRLAQAKADWQASIDGGWTNTPFAMPAGENEWIPLP